MSKRVLEKFGGRLAAIEGNAFDLLTLTGQLADGEIITIAGVNYEADDDATVTEGNIAVDITGNGSAADDVDDLVAAIIANQGDSFRAVDLGDEVAIISRSGAPIGVAETAANASWLSGGASYPGSEEIDDVNVPAIASRVPTAAEVTLGKMPFALGKTPTAVEAFVRVTATGARKQWDGGITIDGELVILDNAGATDWAATDTVVLLATF